MSVEKNERGEREAGGAGAVRPTALVKPGVETRAPAGGDAAGLVCPACGRPVFRPEQLGKRQRLDYAKVSQSGCVCGARLRRYGSDEGGWRVEIEPERAPSPEIERSKDSDLHCPKCNAQVFIAAQSRSRPAFLSRRETKETCSTCGAHVERRTSAAGWKVELAAGLEPGAKSQEPRARSQGSGVNGT